ncbi:MAG TPA: GNAT family N-acetyltransferase [Actinomycetes bacterium]|nr:GNAT family N-acetyltransferase [Actinomycetes bacterium]
MEPVELTDGAVRLRVWASGDGDAVYAACQDDDIQRWTTIPSPYLPEHATQFVSTAPERWDAGIATFAIVDGKTEEIIGSASLTVDSESAVGEIGYWVAPWARRRGVAAAATKLVCDWGLERLSLARIQWQANVGNVASRAVAESCGFTVEGTLRRSLRHRGESVDAWMASLLPGEPRQRKHQRRLPWSPVDVVGDGIQLLPTLSVDPNWVLESYTDPDIQQWNPADVTDLASAAEWARTRSDWSSGTHASWVICGKDPHQPLGALSVHKINEENLTASVGYWTHARARGQGIATAAVRLASTWAMAELGMVRLELIHAVANSASCRVAERAGYLLEGTTRKGERCGDGEWYDEHIHGKV